MSMAVMYWATCIALLASSTVSSTAPQVKNLKVEDENVGNWSVGNCILAKFAMNFTIYPEGGNGSTIILPTSAIADKDQNGTLCSKDIKKVQTLTLSWNEDQKNDTKISLHRFVQIQFKRMENSSYYGVNRFWGKIDVAYYKENVTDPKNPNKTMVEAHNSTLTFDSKEISQLMFHTPNDKSYQCADVGKISLISSMQWNYTKMAPHDVSNTTANAFQVHFDAFRNIPEDNNKSDQFRVSIDCLYQPNDIVPIAVGVALAALVVAVLIAYMVGRRRNRHAGYQVCESLDITSVIFAIVLNRIKHFRFSLNCLIIPLLQNSCF